jgi:endonuclease/exonuclease/phosphatase family metal-dependent hydrolase
LVLWSRVPFRFLALAIAGLGFLTPSARGDEVIRIMAANTTSGNGQDYDLDHGNRIFQGLDPDIALVQELNYLSNSPGEIRGWVDEHFGPSFQYVRESGKSIPNAIVSRYPIIRSGTWDDPELSDREFVWARIDIPGDAHLWAVSIHLKASSGSTNSNRRNNSAEALLGYLDENVPASDHIVIGGDLNTYSRTEACIQTLSAVADTLAPWPADEAGNTNTNAGRSSPYDWVIPGHTLADLSTPLIIGSKSFPAGLVFDSRVYTPLSSVSPVQSGDSAATGMQHMAVMRAFLIPTNDPPVIAQGSSVSVTLSKNNTPTAFSRSLSATDPESNTLTWSIQTQAAHGTAGIVAPVTGGSINLSYQPATNYTGSDSFVVRVSDGQGGTDTITVNLTIQEPPNAAPVVAGAAIRELSISQNGHPVSFQLTLDAQDTDLDPLAWSIFSPASNGTAGMEATGGHAALSYHPASGFTGNDTFTVQVSDGRGGTDTVTVQVAVEAAAALDTWTYAAFQPLDPETEAAVWGESADPDQDGYTNLEEFAHGLHPNVPDAAPNLLSCTLGGAGEDRHAVLTFRMRMDRGNPALDYALRVSSDPAGAWAPVLPEDYASLGDTDLGNGFLARSIRVEIPPELSRRFYQLTYTRPASP